MTRYAIALGSNQGDRYQILASAVAALSESSMRTSVSSLYETQPIGGPEQDPYLNAVFVGEFDMSPRQLLEFTQGIEAKHGRVRDERWGPRTLDLDLVVSDGGEYHDESLDVPHPRAREREFVLRPLAEIWPDAPLGSDTAKDLLANLEPQGVDRLIGDWLPPISNVVPWALVTGQLGLFVLIGVLWAFDGSLPDQGITLLRGLGAAVGAAGAAIALISSRLIGSAMTASPVPARGAVLIDTGPFRFVRHPIYSGVVLLMLGTSVFLNSLAGLVGALILIPYFWFKSRYEEKRLRLAFTGYGRYAESVPNRLIPFLL